MWYANRTQNICFKWMKQQFDGTLWQTADILTKPLASPPKWEHALRLMSIGPSWINDDGKVRHLDSRPACGVNVNHQGGKEDFTKFAVQVTPSFVRQEKPAKGVDLSGLLNPKTGLHKAVVTV